MSWMLEVNHAFHFVRLSQTEVEKLETLQRRLRSQRVLQLTRPIKRFKLDSDTCNQQVGYILLQEQLEIVKSRAVLILFDKKLEKEYNTRHRNYITVARAILLLNRIVTGFSLLSEPITTHNSE